MKKDQRRVPLPDVVFFQEGPGLRKWQWTDDGMKVINVTNILGDAAGTVDVTNTDKYVSLIEFEERYKHFSIECGDLIVASSGNTYGKVGKITENCLPLMMNTSVIRFHSKDQRALDNKYLYAFLRSPDFRNQVEQYVIGGAQPNFGPSHLKKMSIPLPNISIQKDIGEVISSYDDLIENNLRRIQLLEQAARLLYKEWFVHLRFPGHEHVKITNGAPEGWEKKPLSEIADITMGQSPKSEFYNEDGDGLPFHQGVTNFGIRFPSNQTYCTVKSRLAEPGDILFSVRAPVGRINITPDEIVVGRGLAAIRSNQNQQNFLFYALKTHFFKEDMIGGGAIYAAITKKDLHGVELLQPVNSIVNVFMDYVKPIDSQIENLHRTIGQLTKARDLLLPRLMSGEVAV